MFRDGADYVTPISCVHQVGGWNVKPREDGLFFLDGEQEDFDGFGQIRPDQNFYIDKNGNLVIAFDKYEVAAGAQGSPEFVIPQEVIKTILK